MDLTTLPPVFAPQGKVYDSGAPGQASIITVQALKPASLILRGADGSVYFARQLAKGEAFRVPQVAGLTLEVSKADDIQVFVYGRQVDDFRTVDYDAIAMLNVSATQQIKKDSDSAEDALRKENEELRERIAVLEAANKTREDRLAAIEAALLGKASEKSVTVSTK